MSFVDATNIKKGMKLEFEGAPYNVVQADYVKPGKGQAFTRVKLKNLKTGQSLEKTFKSNEKFMLADIDETTMRLLYTEANGGAVFMDDNTFEQITIPASFIGEQSRWLIDDLLYNIVMYNGEPVDLTPPNIIELTVTQTAPGDKGNTASGRVMKPATTNTGAMIQVPIFIVEGEKIRVDTRTGEYVSRV